MNLSGDAVGSTTTDSSGYYEFTCLYNGDYALAPSRQGRAFDPPSRSYSSLVDEVEDGDFVMSVAAAGERLLIQGGRQGYVNPLLGERALIIITPPESGKVDVAIYTLRGELVWQTQASVQAEVQNLVRWAAENSDGQVIASGIYLVRVTGAGMEEVRKVAIVK